MKSINHLEEVGSAIQQANVLQRMDVFYYEDVSLGLVLVQGFDLRHCTARYSR